jgi:hypothetical protein
MPKPKAALVPKDWKSFRLADGTMRQLPEWADKPLGFAFSPDEALRRGAMAKPKDWRKVIKTGRKSRR